LRQIGGAMIWHNGTTDGTTDGATDGATQNR